MTAPQETTLAATSSPSRRVPKAVNVAWPRITVITPSFNQAQFLEQTVTSVLQQDYPNLEYIVIDGGSTDGSIDIIRKYSSQLSYWVSEKDRGQTHAINKGLHRATGEIVAYLNSDDYYLPNTLRTVAEYFRTHPEVDLIHGRCLTVDVRGGKIGERVAAITRYDEILDLWDVWWNKRNFVQPEVFWTKRITEKIGLLREDLYWVMDYEYWVRILRAGGKVGSINAELACFRLQPNQKSTQPERTSTELLNVVRPFIWDMATPISPRKRLELKGKWLYDALFRKEAARSVEQGDDRWRRWMRLLWVFVRNPQLFAVASFRQRLAEALALKKGRLYSMSPGALLLACKKKFDHGLRTSWYREQVAPRILRTRALTGNTSKNCEIHALTSKTDWLNLIWSLKSFYSASKRAYALCIHDDGTLGEVEKNAILNHFPEARFISKPEAEAAVFPQLLSYPRCLEFRRTNQLAPKIFDFAHFLQSDRMLLLDSDVLFFQEPTELLRRIDITQYQKNSVNRDIASAYTVSPEASRKHANVELIERFNSGLGLIHRASLRLDWLEEFLSIPDILSHFWRIEQTLFALCSSRFGVELLPPEYDVRLEGPLSCHPVRHYVGAIRHLFYSEGIRYLHGRGLDRN